MPQIITQLFLNNILHLASIISYLRYVILENIFSYSNIIVKSFFSAD